MTPKVTAASWCKGECAGFKKVLDWLDIGLYFLTPPIEMIGDLEGLRKSRDGGAGQSVSVRKYCK